MSDSPRFIELAGVMYARIDHRGDMPAYPGKAAKVGIMGEPVKPCQEFTFHNSFIDAAAVSRFGISNTIQSDNFIKNVQGWRLDAKTGTAELYGPHRE